MTRYTPQLSLELLADQVANLSRDVEQQTLATKELVKAWEAAQTLVTFIKWASTLVTALSLLWVFVWHGKGV